MDFDPCFDVVGAMEHDGSQWALISFNCSTSSAVNTIEEIKEMMKINGGFKFLECYETMIEDQGHTIIGATYYKTEDAFYAALR
jgi:hypothetical protein